MIIQSLKFYRRTEPSFPIAPIITFVLKFGMNEVDMKNRAFTQMGLALGVGFFLVGCQQNANWANEFAMRAGAPMQNAAQIRERETARFALRDETTLLLESTAVLQDLGFTVEESAPRLGVLAGAKDRDATEVGQVAGQIALTIGLALLGVQYNPVWDKDQLIRVTLTTLPLKSEGAVKMRVSFERIVINNQGLARAERLDAPEFSTGFFDQVRKGLASRGIRA
jgi:hypothetical protein